MSVPPIFPPEKDPDRQEPDPKATERMLGESSEDDVLPASPFRRRAASAIALLFILVILTFLIWFIATHTEQREPGSLLRIPDDGRTPAAVA